MSLKFQKCSQIAIFEGEKSFDKYDLFPRNPDKVGENNFSNLQKYKLLKIQALKLFIICHNCNFFPHEKSLFILEFPLFSIDLTNIYWAVSP